MGATSEVGARWELVRAILERVVDPDLSMFLVNKLFCAEMRRLYRVDAPFARLIEPNVNPFLTFQFQFRSLGRLSPERLYQRLNGDEPFVCRPDRFSVVVRAGDDLHDAFRRCPKGGTLRMEPGEYPLRVTLRIRKNVSVFGDPGAIIRSDGLYDECGAIEVNATNVSFDGVSVYVSFVAQSCKRLLVYGCKFHREVRLERCGQFVAVSNQFEPRYPVVAFETARNLVLRMNSVIVYGVIRRFASNTMRFAMSPFGERDVVFKRRAECESVYT